MRSSLQEQSDTTWHQTHQHTSLQRTALHSEANRRLPRLVKSRTDPNHNKPTYLSEHITRTSVRWTEAQVRDARPPTQRKWDETLG